MLRTHSQTSGWSLTEQDPYNNVVRTTIEAMAAVFGGTQSLHTNALDEAIALPTEFSSRIARNTQLVIQEETGITKVVDPWGGSYMMESLTQDMADKAWELIQEVEEAGGMAKAIETGMPKLRIEEAAAKKQARIDRGEDVIVGRQQVQTRSRKIPLISSISTTRRCARPSSRAWPVSVRNGTRQPWRLFSRTSTSARSAARATCWSCPSRPPAGAPQSGRFLSPWNVNSAASMPRPRLSRAFTAPPLQEDENWQGISKDIDAFVEQHGRRPRMLVCKMGQDGHDRGAKVVATAFADVGFDIDLSPMFSTPEEVARQAIENDVHVVGASSLAAGHKTLVPQLVEELSKQGADDIVVIAGGVIPKQDYQFLLDAGVKCIFGPGTPIPVAARDVLDAVNAAQS